jgi:hypothetical protein
MDGGIRERVEALRQEIAAIQKQKLAYLQMPRPDFVGQARRDQRLKEIMDALKSMTEWREP